MNAPVTGREKLVVERQDHHGLGQVQHRKSEIAASKRHVRRAATLKT
jgi:hypothetical protein